jgi:hypothetical protein
VNEVGGTWHTAVEVPGLGALNTGRSAEVLSVSCASPGNCGAGGFYNNGANDQLAFVVNETGGTWGTARETAGPGAFGRNDIGAMVVSVSCPAAGTCSAGGSYRVAVGNSQQMYPFVVNETGGSWHTAKVVPGLAGLSTDSAEVDSVSCASAGRCSASGLNGGDSFLVDESAGTWGTAHVVPPLARSRIGSETSLDSVSCVATGACTAGGSFLDASLHNVAFVIDKLVPRPTRAVLSLSAARVTHGHEQAERVSVVMSGSGGTPTGSVTIKAGKTVVCVLKLASGKGSCRPAATKLKAGTYHLTAAYAGNADFAPSVSAARTLAVLK